jgi:hypothetical protein
LRVGFRTALPGGDAPDPECVVAVERTVAALESLGHDVEAAPFPELDALPPAAAGIFGTVVARDLDRWGERFGVTITEADVEPTTWFLATIGRSLGSPDFISLVELAQRWSRSAASWWAEGNDILLTPTLPVLPPELGSGVAIDLGPFTMPWNFAGQPAISLPVHVSEAAREYLLDLIEATRKHRDLYLGASPRGSIALYRAAQAYAVVKGQDFVLPDHIKELAPRVLGHRVMVRPEARIAGTTAAHVIEDILKSVAVDAS